MDIFDADSDKTMEGQPRQLRHLHRVAVVVCPQHSLASVALVVDAFRMGNHLPGGHHFELCRVSEDGGPVAHPDGLLTMDGDPGVLSSMDLVIVPSLWTEGPQAVAQQPRIVQALATLPERVLLATFCSGAYLAAAAGRLDHRRATTHWLLAEDLAQRHPQVQVDPSSNLTHDGSVVCSGGSLAAVDGCLYAVQQLAGRAVAKALAQMLVTDLQRGPQTRFVAPVGARRHQDKEIRWLQSQIEARHAQALSLSAMAESVHLTVRTLQRRFLAATGVTPMAYLQSVRIEASKDLLATERLAVTEVAARVGYQDRVAFGRLFKKSTGMTPAAYRQQQGMPI